MELSLDITGLQELDTLLAQLPEQIEQRNVLAHAMKQGGEIIEQAAKENCPVYQGPPREDVEPGKLKESIHTIVRRRKGGVTVKVQTGQGDFKGDEFYGSFIEYGHHVGKRRSWSKKGKFRTAQDSRPFVQPRPFMRPAYDQRKAEAQAVIEAACRQEVQAILDQRSGAASVPFQFESLTEAA